MCVEVRKFVRLRKDKEGRYYGWKAFRLTANRLKFEYGGLPTENKWLVGKYSSGFPHRAPIGATGGPDYKPGFHICARKRDAESIARCLSTGIIKKVYFKEVIITGLSYPRHPVIVARKLFIPKDD